MDNLKRSESEEQQSEDDEESSTKNPIKKFFKQLTHPYQILITPFSLWIGFIQGFMIADFTGVIHNYIYIYTPVKSYFNRCFTIVFRGVCVWHSQRRILLHVLWNLIDHWLYAKRHFNQAFRPHCVFSYRSSILFPNACFHAHLEASVRNVFRVFTNGWLDIILKA